MQSLGMVLLLLVAVAAGFVAWRRRSVLLAAVAAASLAAVVWPWSTTEHRASAVVDVGVDADNAAPQNEVDADDVDEPYLDRLSETTAGAVSQRLEIADRADTASGARNDVEDAADRIRAGIESRMPTAEEARDQVAAAQVRVDATEARFALADAEREEWIALKGSDPTSARLDAEAEIADLEAQIEATNDPATAQRLQVRKARAQQTRASAASAEIRLAELDAARDDATDARDAAQHELETRQAMAEVAESDATLVSVAPVRVEAADRGRGVVRPALAIALLGAAVALVVAAVGRARARVATQPAFAGRASEPELEVEPEPEPDVVMEPEPEPEPEPAPAPALGRLWDDPDRPAPVLRSAPPAHDRDLDLAPMVFAPLPPPPKPEPPQPQAPKPAAPADPRRATPAQPRVVTVLLYRAPGAQAGNEPLPAFEVRGIVSPPPARLRRSDSETHATVDLAREERAERRREEEIDLTDDAAGDIAQDEAGASESAGRGSAPGRAGRTGDPELRERRQE